MLLNINTNKPQAHEISFFCLLSITIVKLFYFYSFTKNVFSTNLNSFVYCMDFIVM